MISELVEVANSEGHASDEVKIAGAEAPGWDEVLMMSPSSVVSEILSEPWLWVRV